MAEGNKGNNKGEGRIVGLEDEPKEKVVAAENPAALKPVHSGGQDSELSGEKVLLTISAGDGDLNKLPVFLSLNGFAYQMPRNVPCVVPKELLGILKDAEVETYEYKDGAMVKNRIKRFSYQSEPYIEGETIVPQAA